MTNVPAPARLIDRVPLGAPLTDPGAILDRFFDWVTSTGIQPYPAQEEALLELVAGKHVVLSTPTGSGKSLVALGLHFKALCEGKRSFYTAPVKALVNEKFFALCDAFGPENVGMLTGDASINWDAPIVCATQEVLANIALHHGVRTDAPYVVVDEFHFYADRDRGWAWQVPLLTLERTTFLLMSATLGNTAAIEEKLAALTGRPVAHVHRDERPVPLDYEWRETPLHESAEVLLEQGRAPIYAVSFTQREAAEVAAALTSAKVATREQRERIAAALATTRFDTPFGKEMKRTLANGVGLHHAGLLPKYRLLVEQLAQQGLLRVVSGTDTLGVGVNIPIRTVLFTGLAKYDGERVRVLSVRDFKQIAGRAGRKGFDERGSVVCQAPEHVTANKAAAAREARGGKRQPKKKTPPTGFVSWTREQFEQLVAKPPETLVSSFAISHGMILALLQRDPELLGRRGGYGALGLLIERCHESPVRKRKLRREAAARFRSLRSARIVQVANHRALVDPDLQRDFSLHQTLSLYFVEAVASLDRESPEYALQVLAVAEAVVDDPVPILRAQLSRAKDELIARLKAEHVPYEERMAKLEELTWPQPEAEFVRATFKLFAAEHPWVSEMSVHPKGVVREMLEGYESFDNAVRRLGIQRSEGLLLRYLGEVLRALERSVPDAAKTDAIHDVLAYLRELVRHTDASLLQEWEARASGDQATPQANALRQRAASGASEGTSWSPLAFQARVRTELQSLVRALAQADYEEAARWVRHDPDEPWDAARFATALAPFLAAHERVAFDPRARRADQTVLRPTAPLRWTVQHVLPDPSGEGSGYLEGEIDLRGGSGAAEGALVRLLGIHP